jgi:hypothetical protein
LGRGDYLALVDELGQGDISTMPEHMMSFEIAIGAVLELESEEIAAVRWRSATQLDGKC